MDDLLFDELPEDPEIAFLMLEDIFHRELNAVQQEWDERSFPNSYYTEYISKTLSAAKELGLDFFKEWSTPSINTFNFNTYLEFRNDVAHYSTALRIRLGKKLRNFSVRLDTKTKKTIHHYIEKIREIIAALPITDRKRERLIDKLYAFANEVEALSLWLRHHEIWGDAGRWLM